MLRWEERWQETDSKSLFSSSCEMPHSSICILMKRHNTWFKMQEPYWLSLASSSSLVFSLWKVRCNFGILISCTVLPLPTCQSESCGSPCERGLRLNRPFLLENTMSIKNITILPSSYELCEWSYEKKILGFV